MEERERERMRKRKEGEEGKSEKGKVWRRESSGLDFGSPIRGRGYITTQQDSRRIKIKKENKDKRD